MAGFIPLPSYNPGGPLNFEPVNNALMNYQGTRFKNQQLEQQAQNALMQQQHWQAENARADETQGWQRQNQTNALMDRNWKIPLEQQKGAAEIGKLQREAAGPEAPANIREWQTFSNLPAEQQQQYLTMKRANQFLDVGDRFVQPNPVAPAGPPRAEVTKNLAAAEQQKVEGKNAGEVNVNRPKAEAALRSLEDQWKLVDNTIDRVTQNANAWTTGAGGVVLSQIPGTPGYDLYNDLTTIQANIGFDKLQSMRDNSPTGGALGQVSEFENRLLQSVRGALQQGQSPQRLRDNLARVKSDLAALQQERRDAFARTYPVKFEGTVEQAAPQQAAPADGGAVPRISSEADYNSLPAGSRYIDPNGIPRTKR